MAVRRDDSRRSQEKEHHQDAARNESESENEVGRTIDGPEEGASDTEVDQEVEEEMDGRATGAEIPIGQQGGEGHGGQPGLVPPCDETGQQKNGCGRGVLFDITHANPEGTLSVPWWLKKRDGLSAWGT